MLKNIKSNYIIKVVFKYVKKKRKLNIIKHNNTLKNILNITKDDFEIYETLKEFNNKYSTNIDDIDIKELNLNGKNLGNEGLNDLTKFTFKGLNKLDLSYNKISDISILKN